MTMDGGDDDNSARYSDNESRTDDSVSDECSSSASPSNRNVAVDSGTKLVTNSKRVVLTFILVAAICCGAAIYSVNKKDERKAFELRFDDIAEQMGDIIRLEANAVVGTVLSLSTSITSLARATEQSFPNVTVPDLELRGTTNSRATQVLQLTFAPLVKSDDKEKWEAYAFEHKNWIDEALEHQERLFHDSLHGEHEDSPIGNETSLRVDRFVYRFENSTHGRPVTQVGRGIDSWHGQYAPVWQQAPVPTDPSIINFDLLSHPVFARHFEYMYESQSGALSEVVDLEFLYGGMFRHGNDESEDHSSHEHKLRNLGADPVSEPYGGTISSFLLEPVFGSFNNRSKDNIVGVVVAVLTWKSLFENILYDAKATISVVVKDSCGDIEFTYSIAGSKAEYIGKGDLHDSKYTHMESTVSFTDSHATSEISGEYESCYYDFKIYPTNDLEALYISHAPLIHAFSISFIFLITAFVFTVYDYFVSIRQNRVLANAKRTTALISSLFPKNVADQLMRSAEEQAQQKAIDSERVKMSHPDSNKMQLKNFLVGGVYDHTIGSLDSKPIAELFPEATIMFADIVGFTAWSSVREPCQVFVLLETVYQAFDSIAKRRRVFKVETIGDCYVAVAGLPDPKKDHAVVMARFARDCLHTMNSLTKKLETSLGPDTGDLSMRIGLHSGPVTAGVLRGDKARFQLFGDTVNTTARIESTGSRNRIHLSQETAELLSTAGKASWITAREDLVRAKGKGELQTHWLDTEIRRRTSGTTATSDSDLSVDETVKNTVVVPSDQSPSRKAPVAKNAESSKTKRLVSWNVDVLSKLLESIVGQRGDATNESFPNNNAACVAQGPSSSTIDEVVEIIELPEYDSKSAAQLGPNLNQVDPAAIDQLHLYVETIASLYRQNAFHNFQHASHVAMSVTKLLSRIVAPCEVLDKMTQNNDDKIQSTLHDHTYGITSDPLTQFACVFAALVHDVDHSGVTNAQLVAEGAAVATTYNKRSPAEQNSIDISWDMLMEDRFSNLRSAIFATTSERQRFRQLVVNSVIATDIADKDLKNLRNARWENAFSNTARAESERDQVNRKATIVIEHLIQASDIAHTMQHWHIYRKWNEHLFVEMLTAYRNGRSAANPADFWYKGEIGFFDFYIIPLAKKLKECGVFGVSSDEYLSYAMKNRKEWELRGQAVVSSMIEKYGVEDKIDCTKE